jgi:integrase
MVLPNGFPRPEQRIQPMKLTKETVARLKLEDGKSDVIFFDDDLPGFGVRLRAGGKAVWVMQYRVGVQQRRETLGDIRKVDLEKARKEAKARFAAVTLGSDPAADKAQAKVKAKRTLGAIVDEYLAFKADRFRPKTMHETTRYLRQSWKPLHGIPIHKVERADVAVQLGRIATESGGVSANRAHAALSGMYSWAMRQGLCDGNPTIATNKQADEEPRERVLLDAEIAPIWAATPDSDYGRIVKLLLLTGQRRDEIGGLRRSEVDLDRRLISLPKERTKNKRPHDVPLSDWAMDILSECPHRGEFMFGRRNGFGGFAVAKRALDQAIMPALAPWRLHDIRRTVATAMADKLGVQPHVIEAVLNHVSGHKAGVAGIYNKAVYAKEKREALTLWADYVRSVVERTEHKVIPLRRREGSSNG